MRAHDDKSHGLIPATLNDYGRDADLMLDDTNLDMLAIAAGGWGVGHKHGAASHLWSGNGNRSTRVQ
jgi:hypothetical protein